MWNNIGRIIFRTELKVWNWLKKIRFEFYLYGKTLPLVLNYVISLWFFVSIILFLFYSIMWLFKSLSPQAQLGNKLISNFPSQSDALSRGTCLGTNSWLYWYEKDRKREKEKEREREKKLSFQRRFELGTFWSIVRGATTWASNTAQ